MTNQTKYRKLLLAKYIETQVMVRGGDISSLMGKPLSYFDYDRIAASIISLLSDTDWNADGLSATDKADIMDWAFMCNYKVDKQMLKELIK
tara:strand:- start:283 stop:555 length:273 start_codon:yes stop_codon:yes gene_type:complete